MLLKTKMKPNLRSHFSCKEQYIGKTEIGYFRLGDKVRLHRQHIRQPKHEKRKAERYLKTWVEWQLHNNFVFTTEVKWHRSSAGIWRLL